MSLIKIIFINATSITASDYNKILLSKPLWMGIPFEKLLIFQTDSLICSNSDYSIDEFMSFDYIGSAWERERPIGLIIDGGSGGFSLRDTKLSLEAINKFTPDIWPGGEDGFFAFHMELINGSVAKFEDCLKFSTQEFFCAKSYGCHRVELLSQNERIAFREYEKNIVSILNNGNSNEYFGPK